jgi:hypothetical protein
MALRPTPAIVDDDDQAKASDLPDVGVVNQVYAQIKNLSHIHIYHRVRP